MRCAVASMCEQRGVELAVLHSQMREVKQNGIEVKAIKCLIQVQSGGIDVMQDSETMRARRGARNTPQLTQMMDTLRVLRGESLERVKGRDDNVVVRVVQGRRGQRGRSGQQGA